jgi:hypothetical protein
MVKNFRLYFPFPPPPLPQHAVLGADNWLGDGSSREKGADWMAKADRETGSSWETRAAWSGEPVRRRSWRRDGGWFGDRRQQGDGAQLGIGSCRRDGCLLGDWSRLVDGSGLGDGIRLGEARRLGDGYGK